MHNKLVPKVDAIDTSGFVLKSKRDTDESSLKKKVIDADKKILDTSGLVKKTNYNAKIIEIEGKIPSVITLSTSAALRADEQRTPSVNTLVEKINYDAKLLDNENILLWLFAIYLQVKHLLKDKTKRFGWYLLLLDLKTTLIWTKK